MPLLVILCNEVTTASCIRLRGIPLLVNIQSLAVMRLDVNHDRLFMAHFLFRHIRIFRTLKVCTYLGQSLYDITDMFIVNH